MAKNEMVNVNGKLILHTYYQRYTILIYWIFFIVNLVLYLGFGIVFISVAVYFLCKMISESKYQKTNQNTTEYDKNATLYEGYCENMSDNIFWSITFVSCSFYLIFLMIYVIREHIRLKSLIVESKLNLKLAEILRKKRISYLNPSGNENRTSRRLAKDAGVYVSNLLFEEHPDVLPVLNHPNIMPPAGVVTDYHIYYDLKKFMFQKRWQDMPGNLPPLTDIVIYIKDTLNGLQYLHDHQIYHLNLCPENISIVSWPNRHSGIAKICGFDFAIKTDVRIIDYQKVGLEWIYRPPEYYAKGNVDAAAVDYWSVGITAYEILTGGMITIYSETSKDQRIHTMIQKEKMLELSFLSSAIEASWAYTFLLGEYDNIVKIEGNNYNITPKGFLKDTWMFVKALMHNIPKQRSTIPKALSTPFITKSINP